MIEPDSAPPREMTDRRAIQLAAQVEMECWRAWYRVDQGFDLPSIVLETADLIENAQALVGRVDGDTPPSV